MPNHMRLGRLYPSQRCDAMQRCEADSEVDCKAEGDSSAESEGSDVIAGDEKKIETHSLKLIKFRCDAMWMSMPMPMRFLSMRCSSKMNSR